MSDQQALAGFLDKWRARWPEWGVLEAFVSLSRRDVTVAWFALQQELTDAAWSGADPRPGEAKLAWWGEELDGWAQGRRRHPLGIALQREPVPWRLLGASLPALLAARGPANDWEQLSGLLDPFAQSSAAVSDGLFDRSETRSPGSAAIGLAAQQVLACGDAAAPLHLRARLGDTGPEQALARAWAAELVARWPGRVGGSRPERILAALQRARLVRLAAGVAPPQPLPRLTALWTGWRAARG